MIKHASLFSQLIDVFDRNKFKKIVNNPMLTNLYTR